MVRFGILGFGLHAVRRLMPGFALARNCRVSALSRRDINRARESASQHNIPLAFDTAEALCQSREVDAVFVATPNACHVNDVLLAIRCGKPVLCEKPMGISAAECRQMVEAARQARVLLGVAQVFRFEDSTARLRERLAAGEVGRPLFARSEFSYPGNTHPRTWIANAALAGGGPIADVGVHCVDALRYILQDEVVRVSARATSDQQSKEVEASAVLTLEFSRSTLGAVLVSARAAYRTPLEIVGESGVLFADDAFNVEHPITLQLKRATTLVDSETVSNRLAYARQVDAFAAEIECKAEFPVPGEHGWQNQEVLDAAYRSLKSGQAEAVPRVATPETA
ncbi:MAG TPA: Gfo/Idh/MocA family oxidoreductase [Terriglobales bacterium]|jgi:1,5-anhydro-D-fructose reductase (1,5-anhydro-D-mannitol-forming)|nr:Gfo/Idh/MocA family oxidoreductase [Terriglobales bacterium]